MDIDGVQNYVAKLRSSWRDQNRSTGALVEIAPVGSMKSKHVLPKGPLDLFDQTNPTRGTSV